MRIISVIVLLCFVSVAAAQYYGSSSQAYRVASGSYGSIVRNPGPMWPAHCTMCLGNHLMRSHGYSYGYLNQIGYRQWQTLHDNCHNTNTVRVVERVPATKAPMIYAPSSDDAIAAALRAAELEPEMLFVDLGCGDGRVVVKAAWLYGCKAVGVDLDKSKVEASKRLAEKYGVSHLCKFYWADVLNVQLDKVDVVYVYLEAETLKKLVPRFKTMKPGAKLISHQHNVKDLVLQRYDAKHELFVWTDVSSYVMEN